MNSDLNVLLTIFIDGTLQKVAICIKDGLNTFPDYEYIREPEIETIWKTYLPAQVDTGTICDLEVINDIVTIGSGIKVDEFVYKQDR